MTGPDPLFTPAQLRAELIGLPLVLLGAVLLFASVWIIAP